MAKLIRKVNLSHHTATVGESIRVDVETASADIGVEINGVRGAHQYLQFRHEGSCTVAVTAWHGKEIEQVGQRVEILKRATKQPVLPIIWAAQDRYQPRVIIFAIANASDELANAHQYLWDFGDGMR